MIDQPLSGGALDLLSRAAAVREAIAQGQFHIISLAPVRRALGVRWVRHEGLVEDFVLRSFRRTAGEDDVILRLNDADFVVVQPSRSPMEALNRVALLTRQTLSHFLGEVRPENIEISIIDQVLPDRIEARRVTQVQLEEAAGAEVVVLGDGDASPPWEPFGDKRSPRKVVTFKRPEGGDLEALYYCEPIWNAARGVVACFYLRTTTFHLRAPGIRELVIPGDLTARTHAVIAQRRLRYARELLAQPAFHDIALTVPIALDVFAHSASRITVAQKLKKLTADEAIRRRLSIELVDVPRHVPVARVTEATAQVKAFARRVSVRLPMLSGRLTDWERTGADGLVVSLDGWSMEGSLRSRLVGLVDHARRAGGVFAAADGIRDPEMAGMAQAAGLSELAGDAVAQAFGDIMAPRAFRLEDLFTVMPRREAG